LKRKSHRFDTANVLALCIFMLTFFTGIAKGNSFGGFVTGLLAGVTLWTIAIVVRASFRAASSWSTTRTLPPAAPTSQHFLVAAEEMERGEMDNGTFAQAYAEGDGDPVRTRAAYLRLRAAFLVKQRP
jgi:hypothetical protein